VGFVRGYPPRQIFNFIFKGMWALIESCMLEIASGFWHTWKTPQFRLTALLLGEANCYCFENGGLVKMTLNANFIITNQFLTSKYS
jgi:hypothetical protein